jgi:hypothetical protein
MMLFDEQAVTNETKPGRRTSKSESPSTVSPCFYFRVNRDFGEVGGRIADLQSVLSYITCFFRDLLLLRLSFPSLSYASWISDFGNRFGTHNIMVFVTETGMEMEMEMESAS